MYDQNPKVLHHPALNHQPAAAPEMVVQFAVGEHFPDYEGEHIAKTVRTYREWLLNDLQEEQLPHVKLLHVQQNQVILL